ncbi:TPA: tail fiber assembly protein [Salmonella enterica]
MTYQYSATTNMFYPESELVVYKSKGNIPEDLKSVSDEVAYQFMGLPPDGKIRGCSNEGLPAWVDIPAPSQDDLISAANQEKKKRVDAANGYINSKQWPGKAAIGRLKGEELAQYNLWLDYLDALGAVDTSSAPDIEWPTPPGEQAT